DVIIPICAYLRESVAGCSRLPSLTVGLLTPSSRIFGLFRGCVERHPNRCLHEVCFLISLVGITRPEEPAQSVFAAARDHVYVKVRHALTHAIVHRDE